MRGKDLLECIEQIDDALVEEAMNPAVVSHRDGHRFKNSIAVKWGMTAACVVVIGISAAAIRTHQNMKEQQIVGDTASPTAMKAADNDDSADGLSGGSMTAGAAGNARADSDGAGNTVSQSAASVSGGDTVSQDLAAGAVSGKESAVAQDAAEIEAESVKEDTAELNYTIISDYYGQKNGAVYDYPAPEKGEFICYHYLQSTMEYYAEQGATTDEADQSIYAYDVVINLFGDIETESGDVYYEELNMLDHANIANEMIEQEYRRLVDLGYAVQLSEDFRLTGIFTKAELDTFQASPDYGYIFRFAGEY